MSWARARDMQASYPYLFYYVQNRQNVLLLLIIFRKKVKEKLHTKAQKDTGTHGLKASVLND